MRLFRPAAAVTLTAATALLISGAPANAVSQIGPHTTFTDFHVTQDGSVPNPPADGENIPNIDSVKSTLRAYYGATSGVDPAHEFSDLAPATTLLPNLTTSQYAKNTKAVAQSILDALPDTAGPDDAVVFDVDSTLLNDYANEEDMFFNYNPTLNGVWVEHHLFPAVPGMAGMVRTLASEGYAIYGITGRPANQKTDTIANLTEQGYTSDGTDAGTPIFNDGNMFLSDVTNQPWIDCTVDGNAACSTVERKALTRKHIEDATADGGFDKTIVMNVGDQWSDLEGGYSEAYTKIPNPSYFLPSANIPGAPASDASMVLPSSYTMKPDGSTGATATDGDALPNEGAVVRVIRAYYNAPNSGDSTGIADKTSSNYITQLNSLTSSWTEQMNSDCAAGAQKVADAKASKKQAKKDVRQAKRQLAKAKKHHHGVKAAKKRLARAQKVLAGITIPATPAAVFDADDTTLWQYDLEDGVLRFNYIPATASVWVHEQKSPAIPGMVSLVQQIHASGCQIFGLTGRPGAGQADDQTADTLGNLEKVGYVDAAGDPLFVADRYFTKPAASSMPSYVDCGDDQSCSTIEFKSSTRAHIEDLGYNIVGNFGDQYSDLHGGYADHTFKLPNPTYYLP